MADTGQGNGGSIGERRVDVWLWLAFLGQSEADALTYPSDRRGNALPREASDEQIADLRAASDRFYAKAGEVAAQHGETLTDERWRAAIERFTDASAYEEPDACEAAPAATATSTDPAPDPSVTPLGCCDLCAEHAITQPAIAEASLGGGVWFSLCHSHAYRAQSGGFRVHFVARAVVIAPDAIEGGAVEGTVTL